jgi:hypothetical protein
MIGSTQKWQLRTNAPEKIQQLGHDAFARRLLPYQNHDRRGLEPGFLESPKS